MPLDSSICPDIRRCALALLLAVAAGTTPAWAQSPVTIDLGLSAGEPGETIEVSVGLSVGNTAPASMILYLLFDPQEITPQTDFYKAAVLAGPVLEAAGKQIDAEVLPNGRELVVVITGLSDTPMASGNLFDLALTIGPGVARGAIVALRGSMESNAAGNDGATRIPVNFTGGTIAVGCEAVDTPQGLTATQNLGDRVELTWNPLAEAGVQYRVYRARVDDIGQAAALGAWQSAVAFTDTTALAAVENRVLGCLPGETIPTRHYYYVRARAADGCLSDFSASAVGFRTGSAKAAPQTAGYGDALGLAAVLAMLSLMGCLGRGRRSAG
jgi:hypothetical protein